jgi:hypothetical protein
MSPEYPREQAIVAEMTQNFQKTVMRGNCLVALGLV